MDRNQLQYPPDQESIRAIEQANDKILPSKVMGYGWNSFFGYTELFTGNFVGVNTGYSLIMSGTGATINVTGQEVDLITGGTSGNNVILRKSPNFFPYLNYNGTSFMRTSFGVSSNTNQTIYMVVGKTSDRYYGFAINNGTILGVVNNRNTETSVVLGNAIFNNVGTVNARIDLTAQFYPKTKCVFYINGQDAGLIMNNLPTCSISEDLGALYEYKIITNENSSKTLKFSYLDFAQQKPNTSQQ